MDWINFFLGITASIIATGIWQLFISVASYVPSKYPDIRGYWQVSHIENGKEVLQSINVKRQFGRHISGKFFATEENVGDMVYSFTGEFVSNSCFKVSFRPDNRVYFDYGVCLFQTNNDGIKINGGSVSFSFKSGKIEPRAITCTRLPSGYR